jgi:hypothetical protein
MRALAARKGDAEGGPKRPSPESPLKPATAQSAEASSEQSPKAAPEQTPKVTTEQPSKAAPEQTSKSVAEQPPQVASEQPSKPSAQRQASAAPEPPTTVAAQTQTKVAAEAQMKVAAEAQTKAVTEQPTKSASVQTINSAPAQPSQGVAAQPLKEPPPKEQKQLAEEKKQLVEEKRVTPDGPNEPEAANTVGDAASLLRRLFPSRFSYKTTSAGTGASPVTSEVNVNLEPLSFDGCSLAWRDQNDTLSVSLADLNPESVTVGPRARPGTTFSKEVWDVGLNATSGAGAFTETKGDGSGAVNQYNGLDLQYDSREKADRVAGVLRQAIRLCGGKP